jgi:hypothetical protein
VGDNRVKASTSFRGVLDFHIQETNLNVLLEDEIDDFIDFAVRIFGFQVFEKVSVTLLNLTPIIRRPLFEHFQVVSFLFDCVGLVVPFDLQLLKTELGKKQL